MNQLIDNLVSARWEFRRDVDEPQRSRPRSRISRLLARGYSGIPTRKAYSGLDVTRDSYASNALAARRFAYHYQLARIGKPDDPNEWGGFTPPTVNASYQASRNDITFPAGILQPPFYDPNADDAYNYGGIGVVIGHEMTHGFDDQGAKYDAEGNLRNWWTDQDLKNQTRTNCIATTFSGNVAPGSHRSKLVTGEETADLAARGAARVRKSLQGRKRG
jgi:putative endopeptidase